ncbi:MAG: NAD(P)H-dependent oxidoreductase [Clostridia bacterium]|nr:NAD(P)H-dependent oxidoreductase [Clostridia bacterium]MBR2735639.1 NAD(P)H-dependent oxidoreductase [Clostridia bacterium]
MKKVLVAYFSATGNTAKLAKCLSETIHADLFEIRPGKVYTEADLNWHDKSSRSSVEMNDRTARPEIAEKVGNMGEYDTVFVGFPIWWYTAPRIINTFLESYDFSDKTVVPFATSGGSEIDGIADKLKTSCSEKTKFKSGKRFSEYDTAILKSWVDSLGIEI